MKSFPNQPFVLSFFTIGIFSAGSALSASRPTVTHTVSPPSTARPKSTAPAAPVTPKNGKGCADLIDQHCSDLFKTSTDPKDPRPGNREFTIAGEKASLKFGDSEKGISLGLISFIDRKLEARNNPPPDFHAALEKEGYYTDLQKLKNEANLVPRSIQNLNAFSKMVSKIGEKHNDALENASIQRVESKFPGYSTKENPTVEEEFFFSDAKESIVKDSSENLWKGTEKWANVEKQFNEMQLNFVEYLKERKTLSPALKKAWIEKIRSVKLVYPDNLDGSSCASTDANAFYRPDHNTFTVCAGFFNATDDFRVVIAHELGHAIDPLTQQLDQERKTSGSKAMIALREEVCNNAPLATCPKSFLKFNHVNTLNPMLAELKFPERAPESFYQCLRYNKKLKPFSDLSPRYTAENLDRDTRADMADKNLFLTLTQPEIINENGRKEKNPYYLNPCGKKSVKANEVSIDSEDEVIFVAAYLCSSEKNPVKRLEAAEKVYKDISVKIYEKKMQVGQSYSGYPALIGGGYAENVGERFADSLASGVYARWLKQTHKDSLEDRRKQSLLGLSFFCDRPSINQAFPDESQWQKKRSYEPHSSGRERLLEFLRSDLRESLACDKDFVREECSL